MSSRPSVAIVGLGLIGGSLALRLRERGYDVRGHARDERTVAAASDKGITAYADLDTMLTELPSDGIVVIATPLPAALELLPRIAAATPDSVTITDVVSTKSPLLTTAREAGAAHRYVGAHPMAGTAESGFAAAYAELLDDATWVVTLDGGTDLPRWRQVTQLALDSGGKVVPADSEWHDHSVAWISHLPHVLAELLAANVAPHSLPAALAAGSFRDATRVAATRPELVDAMLLGNRAMLVEALESFLDQLEQAAVALKGGESRTLTERGYQHRTDWAAAREANRRTTHIDLREPDARERLIGIGARGGYLISGPVSDESDVLTALVF